MTKPVGLQGGVRVTLLCDGPERLRDVQQVFTGRHPGQVAGASIREVSVRGNGVVVFFEDCTTREAAEELRGLFIFIDEGESIPADGGLPRVHELIGCSVRTPDGRVLGTVSAVYDLPAYRMIGVQVEGRSSDVLVPLVDAWIAGTDLTERVVTLVSDELFTEV